MPSTVLVCSKDPVLLETRRLVLTRAGFRVVTVDIRDLNNMPPDPVDLVVIGHTLSQEQRDAMIAASRAEWPNVKILRLVRSTHAHLPTGENEYECDSHSPHRLVEMCRNLLSAPLRTSY
jgi:hypothetical protein